MNRNAQIKDDGVLKNKIAVPVYDGYEFLEVDDIRYSQRDNNYTTFLGGAEVTF